MNAHPKPTYAFGDFVFDSEKLVLFHSGIIVEIAEKKGLEVLAAILESPDHIGLYDQIIESVWPDDHGADSLRVNQYVNRLQKVLATYEPGVPFITNLRGRGYAFVVDVEPMAANAHSVSTPSATETAQSNHPPQTSNSRRVIIVASLLAGLVTIGSTGWWIYDRRHESEVKRVVEESQMYESLVVYKYPERFKMTDLDKYWTEEHETAGNSDRAKIQAAVQKLLMEGRRYGDETKNVQFRFESVDVTVGGDSATARTFEEWQIANYTAAGELIKISTVGPYFVDYLLKNVGGRWLIVRSTTGRTVRPTPRLDSLTFQAPPVPGQEFQVKLNGADFEKLTFFVEIVGVGCPAVKPCKVDNPTLLKFASISDTAVEGIPLTLASGEFQIFARNGDSKPSNPLTIIVP